MSEDAAAAAAARRARESIEAGEPVIPWEHVKAEAEVQPVCSRCGLPAVWLDGEWRHAEAADAAVCLLLFGS